MAMWCSRSATESSHCSGLRSRTRTIRSARCGPHSGCRRTCAGIWQKWLPTEVLPSSAASVSTPVSAEGVIPLSAFFLNLGNPLYVASLRGHRPSPQDGRVSQMLGKPVLAETHRLRGELLLRQDQANAPEAQRCFERAIEVARKQRAKSWEAAREHQRRAATREPWQSEARAMLADNLQLVHRGLRRRRPQGREGFAR